MRLVSLTREMVKTLTTEYPSLREALPPNPTYELSPLLLIGASLETLMALSNLKQVNENEESDN